KLKMRPDKMQWQIGAKRRYPGESGFARLGGVHSMKRAMHLAIAGVAALLFAVPARAADMDAVNKAIEKGVGYLQGLQSVTEGPWRHEQIGLTALCGVTLMECGVPTDDPGIQKAAAAVRSAAVRTDQTYSIALCIIFLDRLGEPVDVA